MNIYTKIAAAVIAIIVAGVVIRIMFPPLTRQHWAVYYGSAPFDPALDIAHMNLLVMDNDGHPDLAMIPNPKTVKLAYVSTGEIADYRNNFKDFKAAGVLLGLKKGQQHVYVIDPRKTEYYPLLKKQIEQAKAQGFNGVMLDTLDTIIALGRSDEIGDVFDGKPAVLPGMNDAAIKLVKQIRTDYPGMKIMVNRGFDIIPALAGTIDMVVAESTISDGKTLYTSDMLAAYNAVRLTLRQSRLPVYALDYWDINDTAGVKKLYAAQRDYGFCPYVSDPSLQKIYPEP